MAGNDEGGEKTDQQRFGCSRLVLAAASPELEEDGQDDGRSGAHQDFDHGALLDSSARLDASSAGTTRSST